MKEMGIIWRQSMTRTDERLPSIRLWRETMGAITLKTSQSPRKSFWWAWKTPAISPREPVRYGLCWHWQLNNFQQLTLCSKHLVSESSEQMQLCLCNKFVFSTAGGQVFKRTSQTFVRHYIDTVVVKVNCPYVVNVLLIMITKLSV